MEASAVGEIVNLRRARKAKDRVRKQQQAAENRTKHGRTKAERRKDVLDAKRHDSAMDGKRLDPDDPR